MNLLPAGAPAPGRWLTALDLKLTPRTARPVA